MFPPFAHIAVTVTDLQRSSLWLVWVGRTGVDARAVVGIVRVHRATSDAQRDGEIEDVVVTAGGRGSTPAVPARAGLMSATTRSFELISIARRIRRGTWYASAMTPIEATHR